MCGVYKNGIAAKHVRVRVTRNEAQNLTGMRSCWILKLDRVLVSHMKWEVTSISFSFEIGKAQVKIYWLPYVEILQNMVFGINSILCQFAFDGTKFQNYKFTPTSLMVLVFISILDGVKVSVLPTSFWIQFIYFWYRFEGHFWYQFQFAGIQFWFGGVSILPNISTVKKYGCLNGVFWYLYHFVCF